MASLIHKLLGRFLSPEHEPAEVAPASDETDAKSRPIEPEGRGASFSDQEMEFYLRARPWLW